MVVCEVCLPKSYWISWIKASENDARSASHIELSAPCWDTYRALECRQSTLEAVCTESDVRT